MKISNSKKQLAKIISENGGWCDGAEFSVSTCSGTIAFSRNKPEYTSKYGFTASGWFMGYRIELCSYLKNWHQCTLSREEYFHLYPVPDADGWIEWSGGFRPVRCAELVDVKYANGTVEQGFSAGCYEWTWGGDGLRIIAYRLHKPAQAKPEFCESVTRSIQEPETKPSIESLAADYRNAKDYADRKQREADDAKSDAYAKLAELVAAGKAHGLVLSVEREGGAGTSIHHPLIAGDLLSWRQWEVGDLISWSIVGHTGEFRVIAVHHDPSREIGDFEVEDKHGGVYRVYSNECKFIRRP